MATPRAAVKLLRIVLCFLTAVIVARTTVASSSVDQYSHIGTLIRREIELGHVTGFAVALTHHGRIVWQEGFGWADKRRRRLATANTPFSIASMTKPFTTTAMMVLAARGRISLDSSANAYLKGPRIASEAWDPNLVTLRELASHASGLPEMSQLFPTGAVTEQPSIADVIQAYGVLVNPPGERFEYSNLGMGIIADIVARQSGVDFGSALQREVLTPLGLRQAFFDTNLSRCSEIAMRYDDSGRPMPFYTTATPGSGELYASAHAVAEFAMFHLKDHLPTQRRILSDSEIDTLHRPAIPIAGNRWYALGWVVGRTRDGTGVLYHPGGQPGVASVMTLLPTNDIACVVLSNRADDQALVSEVRTRAIQTLVPRWEWSDVAAENPKPLSPVYFGTWSGTIRVDASRGIPVRLSISDKRARLKIHNVPARTLYAYGLLRDTFVGTVRGGIGFLPAGVSKVDDVTLRLRLRGRYLEGEIAAESGSGFQTIDAAHLPFWIRLAKIAS
jgi:CubicO group peptidase (beta-lactamase class C family)